MGNEQTSVGPWAIEKLDALQKYLEAYTTILSKQNFDGYVYVDAFAGPGEHAVRNSRPRIQDETQISLPGTEFQPEPPEQIDYINGSPSMALQIARPFTHYVFVELNPKRARRLNDLKEEWGAARNISIRETECNEYLKDRFIDNPRIKIERWRGVVFLDPFGMQVTWSTIQGLARTKSMEIFINFPVGMAIQRMLRRDGRFTKEQRERLDAYLGSPEWHDVVYRSDEGLFGEDVSKVESSGRELVRWYCHKQLRSVFSFVSPARLIRNSRGGHLYYLIHAGHNKVGAKIAEHILAKGEIVS